MTAVPWAAITAQAPPQRPSLRAGRAAIPPGGGSATTPSRIKIASIAPRSLLLSRSPRSTPTTPVTRDRRVLWVVSCSCRGCRHRYSHLVTQRRGTTSALRVKAVTPSPVVGSTDTIHWGWATHYQRDHRVVAATTEVANTILRLPLAIHHHKEVRPTSIRVNLYSIVVVLMMHHCHVLFFCPTLVRLIPVPRIILISLMLYYGLCTHHQTPSWFYRIIYSHRLLPRFTFMLAIFYILLAYFSARLIQLNLFLDSSTCIIFYPIFIFT